MKINVQISLLTIGLLLAGCNSILFTDAMPINGEQVYELPEGIEGRYVSIHHSQTNDVWAWIYDIRINDSGEYELYDSYPKYSDSTHIAHLVKDSSMHIDTTWLVHDRIQIRGTNINLSIPLEDSLESSKPTISSVYNLKTGIVRNGNNTESYPFKITKVDNRYIVATATSGGYYKVFEVQFKKNGFVSLFASIDQKNGDNLNSQLEKRYALQYINGSLIRRYKTSMNDETFFELMNSLAPYQTTIWYKLPKKRPWTNPILRVCLVGAAVGGLLLLWKRIKYRA